MNLSVALDAWVVGNYDSDADGYPDFNLNKSTREWAAFHGITLDYWFDDLGVIWFDFDTRAAAILFMLEYGGEAPQ